MRAHLLLQSACWILRSRLTLETTTGAPHKERGTRSLHPFFGVGRADGGNQPFLFLWTSTLKISQSKLTMPII
jgi:hypothetical protein